MTHHLPLAFRWFDEIASGRKVVEGRPAKPRFERIAAGDVIVFRRGYTSATLRARVRDVRVFSGWGAFCREMSAFAAPGMSNSEAVALYESIYSDWKGACLGIMLSPERKSASS